MGDITIIDVEAKDIHITFSMPLQSLVKVQKCLDNAIVNLESEDESFVYLKDIFLPEIEDIIKKVKGE